MYVGEPEGLLAQQSVGAKPYCLLRTYLIAGKCGRFKIWWICLRMHLAIFKFVRVTYNYNAIVTVMFESIAAFVAIMLTKHFGCPPLANTSAASGKWPIRRTLMHRASGLPLHSAFFLTCSVSSRECHTRALVLLFIGT